MPPQSIVEFLSIYQFFKILTDLSVVQLFCTVMWPTATQTDPFGYAHIILKEISTDEHSSKIPTYFRGVKIPL